MKNLIRLLFVLSFPLALNANVLGEMQTFSPNTDGLDFITVHTARPLPRGYFAFSNYLNFAADHMFVMNNINSNPNNQSVLDYHDRLFEYDFGVTYAWTNNLSLTFQAPVLLSYEAEPQAGIGLTVIQGVHSYRPGFKYVFGDSKSPNWAVLGSVDNPNVVNSPYTGTNPRLIYNIEGVYTWKNKGISQSINMGYRQRSPSDRPTGSYMFPLKSQVTASYGLSKDYSSTARWVFETFVSTATDKSPYKETINASSVDLLLGMKHQWIRNLNFDWGATIEPGVESQSPDYRLFAGLVYYWRPVTAKAPAEAPVVPVNVPEDDYYVPPLEVPAAARLEIDPRVATIYEGSDLQLTASGGSEPYHWQIEKGYGEVDQTGNYTAPFKVGQAVVSVTDFTGNKKSSRIQIVKMSKPDRTLVLSNLEFVTATADLIPASERSIAKDINQLKGIRIKSLVVEGHTDWIGNDKYNLGLSRRRAAFVRKYLINALGLEPSRVTSIGYGEQRPIRSNKTSEGRQKNRRVVLQVFYWKE